MISSLFFFIVGCCRFTSVFKHNEHKTTLNIKLRHPTSESFYVVIKIFKLIIQEICLLLSITSFNHFFRYLCHIVN